MKRTTVRASGQAWLSQTMYFTTRVQPKSKDDDPTRSRGYICSAPRGSGQAVPDSNCPTGWFSMFSACYKFVAQENTADGHHTGLK